MDLATVSSSRVGCYLLAHRWAVETRLNTLRITELSTGEQTDVRDQSLAAFVDEKQASFARMGWSGYDDFASHAQQGPWAPFTQAELLRGSGWQQLFVELTAKCNERCEHCYAGSSPDESEHLSKAAIERAIVGAAQLGFRTIQLTGGDPLVARNFSFALQATLASNISHIEIYTNALRLAGPLFEKIPKDARLSFAVSFYSHDPLQHDRVTRRPGSHKKTLSAIRRIVAAGLRLRCNVITFENDAPEELERTRAFLVAEVVSPHAIGHDRVRSVGRGVHHREPERADAQTGISSTMPTGGVHTGSVEHAAFPGRAAILPNGDVVPCIFSRQHVLGNLAHKSLPAILEDNTALAPPRWSRRSYEACGDAIACHECRVRSLTLSSMQRNVRRLPIQRDAA